MPRIISWLIWLPEIQQKIARSNKSHYTRIELQDLFELQPRSAQKLMECLPRELIGINQIVKKDHLETFLERVRKTRDVDGPAAVPALLDQIRAEKPRADRRKVRILVTRDGQLSANNPLPKSANLRRGHYSFNFKTQEEAMLAVVGFVARMVNDEDAFRRDFCIEGPSPIVRGARVLGEGLRMLKELEALEAQRVTRTSAAATSLEHPG